MKVPSFKKFLEEEDSKAIVQTGLNSKSIDNSVTKEIINSRLANATSNPFLTPYIALGSIARILAYVNIVVPQYTFLDRDEGEVVFDATQVGQIAGVNLDGSPARSEAEHFIYFSYSMNDEGYYDCFAALVDSDELEDIMDMGGDEDVDQFDVDQKVNEELKGDQHEIDVAEPKGKLTAADFKKLRGEKSVDEGEDKKENKSKKNRFLRKLGYKDSPVDFTSPGNTAAMAVRAGRDKLKKEEPTNPAAQAAQELKNRIAAHQAANQAAKPQPVRKPAAAPKSGPSIYDAAQKVKAAPQNPAAKELKARIAAHQQVDEVMNWDEKSHAHPELGSIPAIKQPNIQAHRQAAEFHRKELSQAKKNYKNDRTPENANAVSFHGARMTYHKTKKK